MKLPLKNYGKKLLQMILDQPTEHLTISDSYL